MKKWVAVAIVAPVVAMAALYIGVPDRRALAAAPRSDMGDAGRGIEQLASEPIQPLPQHMSLDPGAVALGARLFAEPRLSHDNRVSCATCHNLAAGGAASSAVSLGINGAKGTRNAPTVFNSGFNFKQFWDGRVDSLEAQVDGPIHNPAELASSWPEIVGKLQQDARYRSDFAELYPAGITAETVRDAIATFERSLSTPSRFDRYLRGERAAITGEELRGYEVFKSYGCVSCHQGVNVGGNMFQKLGVMADFFADRAPASEDFGRFNVTRAERDRHVFKVPSLRNVARTAPYFHDGSVRSLDGAITVMAKYQLGRVLSPDEVRLITEFLKTLDGEPARKRS